MPVRLWSTADLDRLAHGGAEHQFRPSIPNAAASYQRNVIIPMR